MIRHSGSRHTGYLLRRLYPGHRRQVKYARFARSGQNNTKEKIVVAVYVLASRSRAEKGGRQFVLRPWQAKCAPNSRPLWAARGAQVLSHGFGYVSKWPLHMMQNAHAERLKNANHITLAKMSSNEIVRSSYRLHLKDETTFSLSSGFILSCIQSGMTAYVSRSRYLPS